MLGNANSGGTAGPRSTRSAPIEPIKVSTTHLMPPWAVDSYSAPPQRLSAPKTHLTYPGKTTRKTRPPLISVYRGEAPFRSKSNCEINKSLKPSHDGGLFQVYADQRRRPPYYVINPEWLSEAITIRQLGLNARTPITTSNHQNSSQGDSGRIQAKTIRPVHAARPSAFGATHPEISRCKSVPARRPNPITWES
ncbi:unnamed protein product [Calicophoron daubneyi]|uniref:BRCT domain-containing protein n=1 Tax=Calicophoron daubneyi TaxID=300641 RepID=A0AAV2TN66_CALDB